MQTGRRQAPMDIPPSHEQITVKALPGKETENPQFTSFSASG